MQQGPALAGLRQGGSGQKTGPFSICVLPRPLPGAAQRVGVQVALSVSRRKDFSGVKDVPGIKDALYLLLDFKQVRAEFVAKPMTLQQANTMLAG